MAKGIIRITPKRDNPGSLEVTQVETNSFGIQSGSDLSFADPGFALTVGQEVDINLVSDSACTVVQKTR